MLAELTIYFRGDEIAQEYHIRTEADTSDSLDAVTGSITMVDQWCEGSKSPEER